MRRWGLLVALILPFMPLLPASPAAAAGDPPLTVAPATLEAAFGCVDKTFPNAKSANREPVLLVHGTFSDAYENWGSTYLAALPKDGFDACWVNLPNRSLDDIQVSSEYVVYAVHRMFALDGGRPVAMIGHSQGGLEVRWPLRWWPSVQAEVADAITLAAPNHGTTIADPWSQCYRSCWQMKTTSKFIAALNSVTETPGTATSYTAFFSDFDTLVVPERPTSTAAINGPGAANIRVQDVCPGRPTDHIAFAWDAVVYRLVLDALTHPGPANPARTLASSGGQFGLCALTGIGDFQASMAAWQKDFSSFNGFPSTGWVPKEPDVAGYAK